MLYPSLEEVKVKSREYKLIPVFFEMMSDTQTPIHIYNALSEDEENSFIFESVNNSEQWGRYSFIGAKPRKEIKNATQDEIQKILDEHKSPVYHNRPHLTGGLIGYFSYDSSRIAEKKLQKSYEINKITDDIGMPDIHLFLYDEIVAFDHLGNKAIIIINIYADSDIDKAYRDAESKARIIANKINRYIPSTRVNQPFREMSFSSNFSQEVFEENILKAKEYIYAGDIFQIVISQRFECDNPPPSFDVYRMLRMTNPSPYLYYFKTPNYHIAGASPEMLINVTGNTVKNRPIAGTIGRGLTEKEDIRLETELRGDPKECAEHNMLVDLGRNDVGKVCEFGTVEVTDYMKTEKYSKVMHLVSDVQGKLRPDKTPLDALMAVLPAGTLTGAPKIRAMEIIDEFENEKRGLYAGTVGYLGFDGNIDTCIAIRTVLFANNKAYIQAGAGIVADSVPEKEYRETQGKAAAMINAVKSAQTL
ncbi:anthranilate synthase component 1 [Clostridia bacterium]|nr:anthranilate synthase component 1 [Clostridia bacterium]